MTGIPPHTGCERRGTHWATLARSPDGSRIVAYHDAPMNWLGTKLARGWTAFRAEVCGGCDRYVPLEETPKEYRLFLPDPPLIGRRRHP